MSAAGRRSLWLALGASLMLHFAVLSSPGWSLPRDKTEVARLDATLVAPPRPKPAPVARPKPVPRPPPAVPPPVADPAPIPAPSLSPPEPAPEPEPPPVAAEPAVPPAPSFRFAGIWPKSGRIVFQVTRGDKGFVIGKSEHRWTHDGTTYSLRAETGTTGVAALFHPVTVTQESSGVFVAGGLQPLQFRTQKGGKPKDSIEFDMARHRVAFGNGGQDAFADATQDLLSIFYQIGAYSLEEPSFTLAVAAGRRVSQYKVTIGNKQTLDLPFGQRNAIYVRIAAARAGEGDDVTEIWLDAASQLPLKIRHHDRKGEVYDEIAQSIELDIPE